LRYLCCQYCEELSDLSPLSHCMALICLWIGNTAVNDISPLSDCMALCNLDITHSRVGDISPLNHLVALGLDINHHGLLVRN